MRGLQDRAVSRSPWLWLNLVCLDAPLVAICWQWIFAHSFHLSVPIGHRAALFLTAWVIYLADRFGDSVSLITEQPKSVRQQFCLRHKSIWLVSIICVAAVDLVVVLRAVNYETAVSGAVLGAVYHHLCSDQSRAQRNLGDNSAEGIHHRLIVCRRHFARRNTSYFCGKIGNDFRGDPLCLRYVR